MIPITLRDLRWRILFLLPLAALLYRLEPAFHQHEGRDLEAITLGPTGISATIAYFAGLAMIILLGGSVSGDRREGYTRISLSHPTSPLALYGLRWGVSYLIALVASAAFLVLGQVIAWGRFEGGFEGMILPALTALIYGGLVAFLTVVLPRGDTWIAFLFFLPTFVPQLLTLALQGVGPVARQITLLILPPHGAIQQVWESLLMGGSAAGGIVYALAYGLAFLVTAGVLLRLREWP